MRSATMRKKVGLGTVLVFIAIGIALLGSYYLISPASAQTVVFQENFNNVPGGNHASPSQVGAFTITAGDVDVITQGVGDRALDMEGCTNGTIQTTTPLSLSPGSYQLSFEIGRNPSASNNKPNNDPTNGLRVTLGSLIYPPLFFSAPFTLTTETVPFVVTTSTTANLVFREIGVQNCAGSILDDVVLTLHTPTAPPAGGGDSDDDSGSEDSDDDSGSEDDEDSDSGDDD